MELKRHQVYTLPTEDKTSNIWFDNDTGKLLYDPVGVMNCIPQHLYFTNDEEIKEGDWFINTNFQKIYQANSENSKNIIEFGPHPEIRKIISSTDPKLCIECTYKGDDKCKSLPQPSEAFIKAYCEQGGIDEVDVEYERVSAFEQRGLPSRLKINILKVDPVHNTITTHRIVEKVYNKQDLLEVTKQYDT